MTKSWTVQDRTLAWQTYITTPKGTGVWGKLSRMLKKSVKALQTEIWKMHRQDGHPYWSDPDRLAVKLEGRSGEPWSVTEKDVLMTSMECELPLHRIAELLGRTMPECGEKFQEIITQNINKGRRPFGLKG